MDSAVRNKPKTVAELLPGLSGILSKDSIHSLTAKKKPRSTLATTRTTEKVFKPMTIAEMTADIKVLKLQSPKMLVQGGTAKKKWNSSCKLENKTVSHTAGGQMKNHSVRKVLNFQQPKPKIAKISTVSNARINMMNSETPKFHKPEMRAKKSLHHLQAHNSVRISGICHIAETPLLSNKFIKNTTLANKENISKQVVMKKIAMTPKSSIRKKVSHLVSDTPLSNVSWKSSCDASFLQNEKDIEFIECKTKALTEEQTLENIEEVSPPVSTPFKEYRNVKEFFNNSSDIKESSPTAYHDDTIMSFEKTSLSKENSKREESVIVSLCDMLNNATVSKPTTDKTNTGIDDLLEFEKQTENNLKMIESGIKTLISIKESQLHSLQYVRNLINEKRKEPTFEVDTNKTITATTKDMPKIEVEVTPRKSPIVGNPCSILKSCLKSPSYKLPRKNMLCMRKKVFYKSLPNVSNIVVTPPKNMGDRALSMYRKMKEHSNFLNTPVVSKQPFQIPDTPAMMSNNLQKQLDKLYSES